MTPESIALVIDHRRLREAHPCVVPGCTRRARAALHVDAPTRLAGRDWKRGQLVDLCPDHEQELRRVADDAAVCGYGGLYDRPGQPLSEALAQALASVGTKDTNPVDRLREWR